MADVHRDPRDWLECVQEPDAAGSIPETKKELEVEGGPASTRTPGNKREGVVAMTTVRAFDLPPLDVNGANSPQTRVGRGLESIGGMTADTFQRFTTVVGGVVKSPVVLMSKVGGLASPRTASLTSSPSTSLEERVFQLEIQMKGFEERYNLGTVVTEVNVSPHSYKEKPRMMRSLMQEMETEGTLVKRVQMLECNLNERMESIEKALSTIQSQLAHVDLSKYASAAGYDSHDSPSSEPQYYDAEQQGDDLEAMETLKPKLFEEMTAGARFGLGEGSGASVPLEETPAKETTPTERVEPVQKVDTGRGSDVSLEPQLGSTSVESKQAFVTEPMEAAEPVERAQELDSGKSGDVLLQPQVAISLVESAEDLVKKPRESAAPSDGVAESVQRDDGGTFPVSSDWQLASALGELHETFVTEPSAAAASAKFLEIARANSANESSIAPVSMEPQLASAPKDPQEPYEEQPSTAISVATSEEPAEDYEFGKSGTVTGASESPLASSLETPQRDSVTESLTAASSAESAQELSTHKDSDMAMASSEPQVASRSVEDLSVAVPNANFEEPAQEDAADKSGTMLGAGESPLLSPFEEPEDGPVKKPLLVSLSAGSAHGLASQEDIDTAPAFSEAQVASRSVEDPSAAVPNDNVEDPVHEDAAEKSGTMLGALESPSLSSFEEPADDAEDDTVKEALVAASSAVPAHESSLQEDSGGHSDMAVAEPQAAFTTVEERSAAIPSANVEAPVREDAVDKLALVVAPSTASFEEPQEGFKNEILAAAPSAEPAQESATREDNDVLPASSEPQVASKVVEDLSAAVPSANSEEPAEEDAADLSGTMLAAKESSSASSFEEPEVDTVEESLVAGPAHELLSQVNSSGSNEMAVAEPGVASMTVEDPSAAISSANFEEPAREHAAENSGTMLAAEDSPSASSFEELQEDPVKEHLVVSPSAGSARELASREDSDVAPASSELQVASRSVEDPSIAVPSANFEEPAQENAANKSGTRLAAGESPLLSPFEEAEDDSVKESLVAAPSAKFLEPAQEEDFEKSATAAAAASLEAQSASNSEEPQEAFVREPSRGSFQLEGPAQEMSGTWTSTVEESQNGPVGEEAEYKLAEDVKVPDEHVKNIEVFPENQSNLVHVGSDERKSESLAAQDGDERVESEQSGEEFFDADQGSGNFEGWESVAQKPFEGSVVGPREPGEASESDAVAQKSFEKEPPVPAPSTEPAREPDKSEQEPVQAQAQAQEYEQQPAYGHGQEQTQEHEPQLAQEPAQEHGQVPAQPKQQSEQQTEQRPEQEPEQELALQDLAGKSGVTPADSNELGEAITFNSIEQEHENFASSSPTESCKPAPSVEPAQRFAQVPEQQSEQQPVREPAQENLAGKSGVALASLEPLVAAKVDHPQELHAEERSAAEPRVRFEEPAQANAAADERDDLRDILSPSNAEQPLIDTVGSSEGSLSRAKFLESGNPELVETLDQNSLDEAGAAVDTLGMHPAQHEALGKEPLTSAPPTAEFIDSVQEHDAAKSDDVHVFSESQSASALEEPQEDFVTKPSAASKSVELEESLAEEPRAVAPASKLTEESGADKSRLGLVEESPLTSIEEESPNGSMSSLEEGKHGQCEADHKSKEDANIPAGLIEEAFPRSQSDATLAGLKPEAAQDTAERMESAPDEKRHDQGSFLGFAATTSLEPSSAAKLAELFEAEDVRKSGSVLEDSSATSTVAEPAKLPAEEEPLAAVSSSSSSSSAKLEEENHARRRRFARSASEPQFVHKSGDHRNALAKESSVVAQESSVAATPSGSIREQRAAIPEDSVDMQCLPFKLIGEGKPRKESELKLVEDVHGSARKTEADASYVLEPKPSRSKEKEKRRKERKEKEKERKQQDAAPAEDKDRRRSLGLGETEKKGPLRGEEKDSKNLLRSEEKHKQPFRHWRDRLRHAFSVTKDP